MAGAKRKRARAKKKRYVVAIFRDYFLMESGVGTSSLRKAWKFDSVREAERGRDMFAKDDAEIIEL